MRGQDPMVDHQIDPGARRQGGELLQELDRLEQEMSGPVDPVCLQAQEHLPVRGEREAILGDRRPMVARSRATSSSLGGSAGSNSKVPSAASAKTPSSNRLWK